MKASESLILKMSLNLKFFRQKFQKIVILNFETSISREVCDRFRIHLDLI